MSLLFPRTGSSSNRALARIAHSAIAAALALSLAACELLVGDETRTVASVDTLDAADNTARQDAEAPTSSDEASARGDDAARMETADAGVDAHELVDAAPPPVDACAPTSCATTASACVNQCNAAAQACQNACDNGDGNGCSKPCTNQQASCQSQCTQDCVACVSRPGSCVTPAVCP